MPSPRRRGRSQRSSLDSVWFPLTLGFPLAGDHEFADEAEERSAWFQHRDQVMDQWPEQAGTAGRRPHCWWKYDSPEPRDEATSEGEQLERMNELTPREKETIAAWEARRCAVAAERTAAIEDAEGISGDV